MERIYGNCSEILSKLLEFVASNTRQKLELAGFPSTASATSGTKGAAASTKTSTDSSALAPASCELRVEVAAQLSPLLFAHFLSHRTLTLSLARSIPLDAASTTASTSTVEGLASAPSKKERVNYLRLLEIKALRVVELIVRTERYRTKDHAGTDNHGEACAIAALEGLSATTTTYIRPARASDPEDAKTDDSPASDGTEEGGAGAATTEGVASNAATTSTTAVATTTAAASSATTTASGQITSATLASGKTDAGNGAPCLVELVLNMLDSVQTAE